MKKKKIVSRRQFLKMGMTGVSAAALISCGRNTAPAPTETPIPTATRTVIPTHPATVTPTITLTPQPTPTHTPVPTIEIITSGWPIDVKSDEQVRSDPVARATRDAINLWLRDHPDVKITQIALNIWDPQTMAAVVASGQESTYLFGPCVGGGWDREHAVNAFNQGLLADTTALINANRLPERIRPNLWKNWSANSRVGQAYFSFPLDEYTPGTSVYAFRKDILADLEIDQPEIGWAWTEMAKMLRWVTNPVKGRYGLIGSDYLLYEVLGFFGAEILTEIPAPASPWHWRADWSDPRWSDIIQDYRNLMHKEKVILSDSAITGDAEVLALIGSEQSVFGRLNYRAMFGTPSDPDSLAAIADRLGMKFSDVFSVVTAPTGDGFQRDGDVLWGPVSFSPNQSAEQLAAGASLLDWMYFGGGLDMVKSASWLAGNDPRAMFSSFLYMTGRDGYEGVPAKPEEVWGEDMVNRWRAIGELPAQPRKQQFFSSEQNPGPGNQAILDQLYLIGVDPKKVDITAMLNESDQYWNQTAASFTSSMSTDAFRAAAQAYYAALDEYFKVNQPEFYANRFKPFYEGKVLPALG